MGNTQYETLDDYLKALSPRDVRYQNISTVLAQRQLLKEERMDPVVKILRAALKSAPTHKQEALYARDLETARLLNHYETESPRPQRAVEKDEKIVAEDIVQQTSSGTSTATQTTDATTTSDDGAPDAQAPSPITPRP
jgi:hypothetical protein